MSGHDAEILEHGSFSQLWFSLYAISTKHVSKVQQLSLSPHCKQAEIEKNCGVSLGQLTRDWKAFFKHPASLLRTRNIRHTSKMWIKRISPHQYLSQVTGGNRGKGEFTIKTDSIFHHFADPFLPGSGQFCWLEIQEFRCKILSFKTLVVSWGLWSFTAMFLNCTGGLNADTMEKPY